ncbi:MAG: hypothetical protein ACYC6N_11085 [Pirellulaceae bacterium]
MAIRLVLGTLVLLASAAHCDAAGFAMSDNFTVFTPAYPTHDDAQAYAQEVLESAEAWRSAIARQWLGEELPPSVGQTTVNVAFSEQRDAGITWAKDDRRLKYHTLYLTTTPDRALGSTLAHEMVHVVLATRFPHPHRLPAWLEEGIAGSYDDDSRQETRQKILEWMVKTDNWPDIETILHTRNIPHNDKQTYAVASSLTQFLLTRGDQRTLLEFGQHASKLGLDAALSKSYRFRNVVELQQAWQNWVPQSLTRS